MMSTPRSFCAPIMSAPSRPQRRGRALPGIAAVQQQRVRPRGAQALHERGEVRVAADLAVAARGTLEIEVGEGVRRGAARADAEMLQEGFTHEVRRTPGRFGNADIHARLAEVHWQQLRVRIGHVQQRNIAERRQIVELAGSLRRGCTRAQACPRRRGEGQEPEKLASLHGGYSMIARRRDYQPPLLTDQNCAVARSASGYRQ